MLTPDIPLDNPLGLFLVVWTVIAVLAGVGGLIRLTLLGIHLAGVRFGLMATQPTAEDLREYRRHEQLLHEANERTVRLKGLEGHVSDGPWARGESDPVWDRIAAEAAQARRVQDDERRWLDEHPLVR